MAKLKLTKIDGARRQIDGAIGSLFSDGDSVPVLTLAFAAFRVLRDLAKAHNNKKVLQFVSRMEDCIEPGRLKEFYSYINAPASFLKHADQDPDDVLSGVDDDVADTILFLSCIFYVGLSYPPTRRMYVFLIWFIVKNPNFLNEDSDMKKQLLRIEEQLGQRWELGSMSRGEWIEVGMARLRETL